MQKLIRTLLFLSAVLAVTATARNAYADSFSVSWSGPDGPGVAMFTATDLGSGMFSVTSISGTQNGTSISLLNAGVYGANDNKLIFPAAPGLVDSSGIGFTDGTIDFNIFWNGSAPVECNSTASPSCLALADGSPLESFSVSPNASVPEPSGMMLLSLSASLLFLIGFVRRKSFRCLAA